MVEECKNLEKQAKQNEKEDLDKTINLYIEAARCFARHDNEKHKKSNYERAARLLREKGRITDNPETAFQFYEQSSSLYKKIDKEKDARKIISEAQKKFVSTAKEIQSEAREMENIEESAEMFALASHYYIEGGEEDLSRAAWLDLGDQYHKRADDMDDPVPALGMFKLAANNYRKGESEEKAIEALDNAGAKFYRKAEEIFKTKQDLVTAYYHYTQAASVYIHLGEVEKQVHVEEKSAEIRNIIGMPAEVILNFLNSEGLKPVSLIQEDTVSRTQPIPPDSIEPEIPTVPKDEELVEETKEITEKQEMSPRVSSPVTTAPASESIETALEPSHTIPTPNLQTSSPKASASEINRDNTSEVGDPRNMQEKLREEFQTGEDIGKDVSEEPKQEKQRDHLLDDALSQTVEDLIPDMDEEIVKKEEHAAPSYEVPTRGPIIDMLFTQGYISSNTPSTDELQGVPEYVILSIIIQFHPISLEDIESVTDISSISMVLSNLTADGLIKQTNDYRYTITQIVEEGLNAETPIKEEEELGMIPDSNAEQTSDFEVQVIAALNKYGIISDPEISSTQLKEIAEIEIIQCLINQGPSALDLIKEKVTSIPSVQVTSIISRLRTDGIVSQNDDGNWYLTERFLAEINSQPELFKS